MWRASWIASLSAAGVDTGAKHMVPTHTTALWSVLGSITAYGCASIAARANPALPVLTLILCRSRSRARANTDAMRPYWRGRAATDSSARRALAT